MRIEYIDPGKLIPYEFNNKRHSVEQTDRIANSIKQFGFNQPIVIDESNIVIVGHARLTAAQKLGLAEVPVLKKADLTESAKRAYRIIDNKLSDDAEWDYEYLELETEWLKEQDFPLEDFGLDDIKEPDGGEVKEDNFEPPEEIQTDIKLGDLIELGRHRVLCGDSTNDDSWKYLVIKRPSLCFTSPPYNAGMNTLGGNKNRVDSKYLNDNDDKTAQDYLELLCKFTASAINYCDVTCVNLQLLANNKTVIPHWWSTYSDKLIDQAIWYKGHGQPAAAAHVLNSRFEYLFIFSCDNNPSRAIPNATFHGTVSNVYEGRGNSGENKESKSHAATFPIHLADWVINTIDKSGDIVIDPFLGSGTTLIAADQLGRICYGMEIEPKYCQVVIDRYFKYCKDNEKEFSCKINGQPYFG